MTNRIPRSNRSERTAVLARMADDRMLRLRVIRDVNLDLHQRDMERINQYVLEGQEIRPERLIVQWAQRTKARADTAEAAMAKAQDLIFATYAQNGLPLVCRNSL